MSVTLNVCQGSTILMLSAHNISIKVLIYRANEKQHSKLKHRVEDAQNFALSKIRQGSYKALLQNFILSGSQKNGDSANCQLWLINSLNLYPHGDELQKPSCKNKFHICYITNSVKIEFNHMMSKNSEKCCLFVSLSKLIPNPTPLYLLQPNLSQVKVGLTTKRQHTFHVWNFLISKHYISSQYKFKRVIQMLDVLSNL